METEPQAALTQERKKSASLPMSWEIQLVKWIHYRAPLLLA